jgi:hypothetical protein
MVARARASSTVVVATMLAVVPAIVALYREVFGAPP